MTLSCLSLYTYIHQVHSGKASIKKFISQTGTSSSCFLIKTTCSQLHFVDYSAICQSEMLWELAWTSGVCIIHCCCLLFYRNLLAGILPFGAVFIELFFILSVSNCIKLCVCVCVHERERMGEWVYVCVCVCVYVPYWHGSRRDKNHALNYWLCKWLMVIFTLVKTAEIVLLYVYFWWKRFLTAVFYFFTTDALLLLLLLFAICRPSGKTSSTIYLASCSWFLSFLVVVFHKSQLWWHISSCVLRYVKSSFRTLGNVCKEGKHLQYYSSWLNIFISINLVNLKTESHNMGAIERQIILTL